VKAQWLASAVLLGLLGMAAPVQADTNPVFTPVELTKQSTLIVHLEFRSVSDKGLATATVRKVVKGRLERKEITVDLFAGPFEAQGKQIARMITGGTKEALLFVGKFDFDDGDGGSPYDDERPAYMHLGGLWFTLSLYEEDNIWELDKEDSFWLMAWEGGTDMLLRAVEYCLSDPDAKVPAYAGVEWAGAVKVGKVEGQVFAAAAVSLSGRDGADLFLACDKGDRLYRWNGGTLEDVTAKEAPGSASRVFAWGDFNGDGRLDLASHGGRALRLFLRREDGTWTPVSLKADAELKDGCTGLATVDCGRTIRTALVASTKGAPTLLMPMPGGGTLVETLPAAGEALRKDLGDGGRCLAEDFDGDGRTDVLQLYAAAGLFYKGTKADKFAEPVKTEAALGAGRAAPCVGDWDADGLPDLFVTAEDRNRVWQNLGGGRFAEVCHGKDNSSATPSGDVAYIAESGGIAARSGDFNNDGRPDLLIAYAKERCPELFFNRGFRSLCKDYRLDACERNLLPQRGEGQQAACLGDFNGDGALDMAVVLAGGDLWVFPRKVENGNNRAVVVSLPAGAKHTGPVAVWAYAGERLLGSWPIRAGEPGTIIGVEKPGTVTLRWHVAGRKAQEKQVVVKDGPLGVVLKAN